MANEAGAVGLLILLAIGGALIGFNLVETVLGFELGLGFDDINGFVSGMWILIARAVGFVLIGLSGYVIFNIIKQ